jgi:hypothetical protein
MLCCRGPGSVPGSGTPHRRSRSPPRPEVRRGQHRARQGGDRVDDVASVARVGGREPTLIGVEISQPGEGGPQIVLKLGETRVSRATFSATFSSRRITGSCGSSKA